MLREHLRNVLLILGVGFSTHWVTKVWTGLTIVLKAHGDGLEMASLQNVLLMTLVRIPSGFHQAPDPFGR